MNVVFDTISNLPSCKSLNDLRSSQIPEPPIAYINQLEIDQYWCVMNYNNIANAPTIVSSKFGTGY